MNATKKTLTFYRPDLTTRKLIPFADLGIRAGFPSPAQDYIELNIDLNEELIHNSSATFFARVNGDSMKDAGIEDGDLLIIDRSINPISGQMAVCFIDGDFTVKRIDIKKDVVWLLPANEAYEPIKVTEENEFIIWGIVTYAIKDLNHRK